MSYTTESNHSQVAENNAMERVTFRAPPELITDLERAIRDSEYHTRSQFLREQCADFVEGQNG